jgi:hypothetical protein
MGTYRPDASELNRNRARLCIFTFGLLALAGCSDIQTRTYEVKLSADSTLHEVELYREIEAGEPTRTFAYSIEFPRSYYYYRDNQRHLKQTKIGLLFDRDTLGPLAPAVVQEAARRKYGKKYVLPERLLEERYGARSLVVTITGLRGEQNIRRPTSSLESLAESPDYVWQTRPTPGNPGSGDAMLNGYSLTDPLVRVSCPSIEGDCSVEIQYLRSRVQFNWPKAELGAAIPVARRLTDILARHTRRQAS